MGTLEECGKAFWHVSDRPWIGIDAQGSGGRGQKACHHSSAGVRRVGRRGAPEVIKINHAAKLAPLRIRKVLPVPGCSRGIGSGECGEDQGVSMVCRGKRLGQQREHRHAAPPYHSFVAAAVVVEARCNQNGSVLAAGQRANHIWKSLVGDVLHLDFVLSAAGLFKHRAQGLYALFGSLGRLLYTLLNDGAVDAEESNVIGQAGGGQTKKKNQAGACQQQLASDGLSVVDHCLDRCSVGQRTHYRPVVTKKTKDPPCDGSFGLFCNLRRAV